MFKNSNSNKGNVFSNRKTNSKSFPILKPSSSTIRIGIWALICLLIILIIGYITAFTIKYCTTKCFKKKNYFKYLFSFCWSEVCDSPEENVRTNIHYMDESINSEDSELKEMGEVIDDDKQKMSKKDEVFHIQNQDYTYEQARCKCESYDAKLATKSQIVGAYNEGANWCSYGWSEGQNAYYPTQKCEWNKIQRKDPKNKDKCGKPGINGGFFGDPYLKFGANCYGKKPKGEIVKEKKAECEKQPFCERKGNFSASHRLTTDVISPFNSEQWNE